MGDLIGPTIGKILTLLGYDGTVFRPVAIDNGGNLQVDVLTSALPGGGSTAAAQALALAELSLMADIRYQGDHVVQDMGEATVPDMTWTDVTTYTVPVGKVAYVYAWGGASSELSEFYSLRLIVDGVNVIQDKGDFCTIQMVGVCFAKVLAGDIVKVAGWHKAGVDRYFSAFLVMLVEDA